VIVSGIEASPIDGKILTLDETMLAKLAKKRSKRARRQRDQHADPPHPLALLRARGRRPSGRRAAEQRDELPSLQLIEWHSVPFQPGRIAGYRIGEERSAGSGRRRLERGGQPRRA